MFSTYRRGNLVSMTSSKVVKKYDYFSLHDTFLNTESHVCVVCLHIAVVKLR